MEKYCDANLNSYIKVKLTEEGIMVYIKHYKKYNCEAPKLKRDNEGYVQFQIHEFMNIFGGHLVGATMPCETNCKIQVKDEWHNIKENPNDLPKKEKLGQTFVVAFTFNEQTQKYYSFDCAEYIDKGKFVTHTFDVNNDNNAYKIIAWCEIPTFTNKGKV